MGLTLLTAASAAAEVGGSGLATVGLESAIIVPEDVTAVVEVGAAVELEVEEVGMDKVEGGVGRETIEVGEAADEGSEGVEGEVREVGAGKVVGGAVMEGEGVEGAGPFLEGAGGGGAGPLVALLSVTPVGVT